MTASSMNVCANDKQLQDRVVAVAQKELVYNAELADTTYGKQLRQGQYINVMPLMWPLAADQEQNYLDAMLAGRGAPGHDADVIPDDAILSAIKSFWPADPVTTPTTPAMNPLPATKAEGGTT